MAFGIQQEILQKKKRGKKIRRFRFFFVYNPTISGYLTKNIAKKNGENNPTISGFFIYNPTTSGYDFGLSNKKYRKKEGGKQSDDFVFFYI